MSIFGKTIQNKIDFLFNIRIYLLKLYIDREVARIKKQFDETGISPDYIDSIHARYPFALVSVIVPTDPENVPLPENDVVTIDAHYKNTDTDGLFFNNMLYRTMKSKMSPLSLYLNNKIIEVRKHLGLPITTSQIEANKINRP